MKKAVVSVKIVEVANVDLNTTNKPIIIHMDRPKPSSLVQALRVLINLSKDEFGPGLSVVEQTSIKTGAPTYWIEAVINGWSAFANKYGRPFASEISSSGVVRFLRANMLPDLKFEDSDRICRLCGFACHPPSKTWHKECWLAFEPSTSIGWKNITKQALKRCGAKCEACGADFKMLKQTTLTPWRRVYDIDHKIALVNGGTHSADNIQVLCQNCHKAKTKRDLYGEEGEWDE